MRLTTATFAAIAALGLSACQVQGEPFLPTDLDYSHQSYEEYGGQWAWLTCENIDEIAAQVAAIRHLTDKSLDTALAEVMGSKTATAPVKRVVMQVTRDAWAHPRAVEGAVENAIADFRDEISTQCESRHGYSTRSRQ